MDFFSAITDQPLLLILLVAVVVAITSGLVIYCCNDPNSYKIAAADRAFEREIASIEQELRELERPVIVLATARDKEEKLARERLLRISQEPGDEDDGFLADPPSDEEHAANWLRRRTVANLKSTGTSEFNPPIVSAAQTQYESSTFTDAWRASRVSQLSSQ
jgi:hypothetical protein